VQDRTSSTALGRALGAVVVPLDRLFNRLFGSEFSPMYRSGTLAVGLMAIALVTGTYLLFFYKLGEPYESIAAIQSQAWLGRWVRTAHRYSSDAAVFAIVLHVIRMTIQGKSWGPRILAWITGVMLMVFMFVSAWTGYVMVWDTHAQALATQGAAIFDSLGLLTDPVSRSFDGSVAVPPASFFFMNIFLHIVVPLSMIFGIWVHTSKMAHAVWLPHRKLMAVMVAMTILISILWPAPLAEKANLLKMSGRVPLDWFYNFWLPLAYGQPRLVMILWVVGVGLLTSVPFWLKPRADHRPGPSFNDPKACTGCRQCVTDCPYEAISMIPRPEGKGSLEVALVDPSLCVSCGICAASCSSFTMGPAGRKASDQFAAARAFIEAAGARTSEEVLVVGCGNQMATLDRIQRFSREEGGLRVYPVQCAGTVHASTLEQFAKSFKAVAIAACPERDCTNKDGFTLLSERLSGERSPTLGKRFDRKKIPHFAVGPGEEQMFFRDLRALKQGKAPANPATRWSMARAAVASVVILVPIAWLSALPWGHEPPGGVLRLSWRLPGQSSKTCRPATQEELAKVPLHMRMTEICDQVQLSYNLRLVVDGKPLIVERVKPGGFNRDRPLYVDRDLKLEEGAHNVAVEFEPENGAVGNRYRYNDKVIIRHRGISLISITPDLRDLVLKEDPSL